MIEIEIDSINRFDHIDRSIDSEAWEWYYMRVFHDLNARPFNSQYSPILVLIWPSLQSPDTRHALFRHDELWNTSAKNKPEAQGQNTESCSAKDRKHQPKTIPVSGLVLTQLPLQTQVVSSM
ncbi:hypothetical protein MANI_030396 [Metarhizium anisopliae]|nr:hypothetical protein MANI_030396 [Metarhizium anisopliae]